MRRPTPARGSVFAALAAVAALGCSDLDTLWERATQPPDAAAPIDAEALSLPRDPSVAPRADDDAGGSALEPEPEPELPDAGSVDAPDAAAPDAAAPDAATTDATSDASAPDASASDADTADVTVVPDAPAPVTITALGWRTAVVEAPRANARWVGYLRAGGPVAVLRGPVGHAGCPARRGVAGAGWYEVEGGGYVCVGPLAVLSASLAEHPIASRLPDPPDLAAAMPFAYGRANRATPVFRRLPSADDLRAFEAGRLNAPAAPTAAPAGSPPRLEDLLGAPGSALQRRLLPGMYVSLHRESRADDGASYWHTQTGGYVRASSLSPLRPAAQFEGVALDGERHLPLAFVAGASATTYRASGRTMTPAGRVWHHAIVQLVDEPAVTLAGEAYHRTADGTFVRARQVRVVARREPPADLGADDEKWIDVNLDRQSVVAYEGARPVYASVVSTGRRDRANPAQNYETIQGGFRILSKHVATTMDGNSANDGPYSIDDVPWVMYFDGSFALHGAFWHNGFGATHSHGCVNMSPPDARWFYHWTEPHVPAGWSGFYADAQHPGTRVYVHYDDQRLGERGGPARVPQH
ncbi:MAG: L,D-transpeptidase [Deltaproteobacteria bacterium]|nr:L,D-transpeptidase [Myxococcales bacterium]MDP3218187.1 L,D-transpeptidase [Deltaproteobacteria bacterium]